MNLKSDHAQFLKSGRALGLSVGRCLMLAVCLSSACATFGRKHLDYTGLSGADRVEVRSTGDQLLAMITDPSKVQYAVNFSLQRQDRWGDRVNPWVPTFVLHFYAKDREVGGYGIGRDILVALPDQGFWWRDVPPADIAALQSKRDRRHGTPARKGNARVPNSRHCPCSYPAKSS